MQTFHITPPDETLRPLIQEKIDNLNKPKGSLGRLETLAMQICLAQQTLTPSLAHPCHLLLGGDHGIEREGVSVSPREVTWQQMINFTRGGGGVNMFCNFLHEPAMSLDEYDRTLCVGIDLVNACHAEGCQVICLGEMGIANTSPSSIWMHLFCHIPLDECIGAGAGLNAAGINHKRDILHQALDNFQLSTVNCQLSTEIIRYFGGFEMVAAIGAMLRAAELKMLILVDGFIMTACALAACQLHPAAKAYMIFGHCGDESGHRRMLEALGAEPLLSLGMRLGEGTGALCAFPIVDSAVRMMNEMNNFSNANITKYF